MRKLILFITLLFVATGCNVSLVNTNVSFDGLYINSDKYKELLTNIDCKNKSKNIYLTNGIELRNCIINNKKPALVYIWSLHCKSESCVNIEFFIRFCKENNVVPYIVIEYLTEKDLNYYKSLDVDLYVINNTYYKTKFVNSYSKKFRQDLIQEKRTLGNRYIFFDENAKVTSL
ncbi:hypothetical protein P3875_10755 [Myroides sp. JBRI-B21084]|uniref:hypothetical protein n=1 Tax=Myroides sp. JBRI-B21084 TaxID=3119977 RepID=UPI0026E26A5E|nr:hypothetical protein [Paenimyroides cloacae]WKW46242.1 hypothetical protein P3875_10755 [Paenimyroides cloacae]